MTHRSSAAGWLVLAFVAALALGFARPAAAQSDLFISEYVEGTSNNKAIEIFNGTASTITLTGNYRLRLFFNGSVSFTTINLTGSIAPGATFVVANNAAGAAILGVANQTSGSLTFNGNDAVVLDKTSPALTILDSIGKVGQDPGTEWGTGLTSTADNTLRRKKTVCGGDSNTGDTFDPSVEWDGFATDTFGGLGSHDIDTDDDGTPDCTDLCPTDPLKTAPGACGCGVPDVATTYYQDADHDGFGNPSVSTPGFTCTVPAGYVANNTDLCDNDAAKTAPGACGCGVPDVATTYYQDADHDGFGNPSVSTPGFTCTVPAGYVANNTDLCDNDAAKTAPGTCGCGTPDIDSDGDGTPDCVDGCPSDPAKTTPGACGCGLLDVDSDGDGVANCIDGCPNDPNKTSPGVCGCGVADGDSDGDGTLNCLDGCPNDPLKTAPGTCGCGVADADADGDGTPDCTDGCPGDPLKTAPGVCGCGVPDEPVTYYHDGDGDGYGDAAHSQPGFACSIPSGYVLDATDCDDFNPNVHPGAPEICGNNIDDDCDGDVDEGFEALAVVYVDDDFALLNPGDDPPGAATAYGCDAFADIQAAINAVAAGGSVVVAPGAYAQQLSIGKPLSLLGPHAADCPGTSLDRGGEAVLLPAFDQAIGAMVIYVTSSDVTIKGFTIDGDNPALNGGELVNGVDVNAANAVANGSFDDGTWPFVSIRNLTVENNIILNMNDVAALLYNDGSAPVSDGNSISCNRFDNVAAVNSLGYDRIGVLLYNDAYAAVDHNVMTRVAIGVQTGNNYRSKESGAASVSSNSIEYDAVGIWHNLHYADASDWTIDDNDLTALVPTTAFPNYGLYISSIYGDVNVSVNDNDVTGIVSLGVGVRAWNDPTNVPIAINGGVITNGASGIELVNDDPTYGPGAETTLAVNNVQITGSQTGVAVIDDGVGADDVLALINQLTQTGGGSGSIGVHVYGSRASASVIASGMTGNVNGSGALVSAGRALFEGCDFTGNSYGLQAEAGAVVDAGDCSDSNTTGLGTGSAANGSSTGGNDFSGYPANAGPPFAIVNANGNSEPVILAQGNDYGFPSVIANLDDIFFDGTDNAAYAEIIASQAGDTDGDGVQDCADGCPLDPLKAAPGVCGCGTPDTDSDGDGSPDCGDACPEDPNKTAPGICGCGVPDVDTDGDGTFDCFDGCPFDPAKVAPGICGCGVADFDSDGDGTPDCADGCPSDPHKTAAGACGCGIPDIDTDGDGTFDCADGCPLDPLKIAPGTCGCGVRDTDSDGDGAADCIDGCPNDPLKTSPGVCGCGASDADTDGDGVADCEDGCPSDPNKTSPGQCGCGFADTDSDGDGVADCLDLCPGFDDHLDADGDGSPDGCDGCPFDPHKTAPGACGCGVRDADADGDGTPDCVDGCPADPNKVAPGTCGCGLADTDSDGDGTPDCIDGCPIDPDKAAPGQCGCGTPDVDSDGDGLADCLDGCPTDPDKTAPGQCGCGFADTDADGDGTADCNDGCPIDPNKIAPGTCGCGVPDADTDGDGVFDCNDGCPADPNKIAPGTCGCGFADVDSDGDSIPDCVDHCPGQPDLDSDGDGTYDCADGCPNDPNKIAPGTCGCGFVDTDTDGDGTADCFDLCPLDPLKIAPGQCGCGAPDTDTDGDGTADCNDGCPLDPDKTAPGLCGCGVADVDSDGDSVPDCLDLCPLDPLKITPGQCGCGFADIDSDGDGLADCLDLCPFDPLKITPGACGCSVPDLDADGDGVADCHDICPGHPDSVDSDGDGVPDGCDQCPGHPDSVDCNGNGVPDACDISNGDSLDLNRNGIPDECQSCRADVLPAGGDGVVDVDDLFAIINAWGTSNPQFDVFPAGGDGVIDTDDLFYVINSWGICPP